MSALIDERQAVIADRLRFVRDNISGAAHRVGRDPADVTLVAVSKNAPASDVLAAYAAGQRIFGENRLQEALTKRDEGQLEHACPEARWRLIGHLQRNKARRAVARFAAIDSVDGIGLAREISAEAERAGVRCHILLQVNVSREPSKFGFAEEALDEAVTAVSAMPGLEIDGLMTMAPLASSEQATRHLFGRLRELRDELRDRYPQAGSWRDLSMGMTDDYVLGVEEGSTLVRVGRAIFGREGRP